MTEITDIVRRYEARKKTRDAFPLRPGLEVRVQTKIQEGGKERTQTFEGLVVALHGAGHGKTFTVRRLVGGIGVERVFPVHSPRVLSVDIIGASKVRRSKLTYLRKSNVRHRMKEDQKVFGKAIAEQQAQRRAVEKARRDAEEKERAEKEAAKKAEAPAEEKNAETPESTEPAAS